MKLFLYVVLVYKIHRVDQMQHYHFSRVDQVGIDQMRIDQMGVDQVGINHITNMCKLTWIW